MKKIAIGLPSFNECDSIGRVTSVIDIGLQSYFNDFSSVIVNIDNDSKDGTKNVFLGTPTKVSKISLTTHIPGKGTNVFKFLEYCSLHNIDYIAIFDSDLKSIEPEWVLKMLEPIINQKAHYTVPVYKRNKYEGNTTNHLCYPILSAVLKVPIRQPIAGDFGMSLKLIKYIMTKSINENAKRYGIDIFMTLHAVGGGFNISEVFLGEKIHKPSFGKMAPMFCEVASTMFYVLPMYLSRAFDSSLGKFNIESEEHRSGFSDFVNKPSNEDISKQERLAMNLILEQEYLSDILVDLHKEIYESYSKTKKLDISSWGKILKTIVDQLKTEQSEERCQALAEFLLPLYLLRVITYFEEIDVLPNESIDDLISSEIASIQQ